LIIHQENEKVNTFFYKIFIEKSKVMCYNTKYGNITIVKNKNLLFFKFKNLRGQGI